MWSFPRARIPSRRSKISVSLFCSGESSWGIGDQLVSAKCCYGARFILYCLIYRALPRVLLRTNAPPPSPSPSTLWVPLFLFRWLACNFFRCLFLGLGPRGQCTRFCIDIMTDRRSPFLVRSRFGIGTNFESIDEFHTDFDSMLWLSNDFIILLNVYANLSKPAFENKFKNSSIFVWIFLCKLEKHNYRFKSTIRQLRIPTR